MSADDLTRPERYAEITQAHRVMARMKVKTKKCGVCRICVHREETFGVYHCRNNPDRRHPQCERDGKAARFTFDDSVLGEFADAA